MLSCTRMPTQDRYGSGVNTVPFALEAFLYIAVLDGFTCSFPFRGTCAIRAAQYHHGHLQDSQLCGLPAL